MAIYWFSTVIDAYILHCIKCDRKQCFDKENQAKWALKNHVSCV